ncbi:MAG: helix-turn-helix transcriptional regulator [Trueperaceae bacterium]
MRREREVLSLASEGLTVCQISKRLGICSTTINKHVANMLGKSALRNRVEIARWTFGHGQH